MTVLPDGTYDVLVLDVGAATADEGSRLDLVVVTGEHRGEVVVLRSAAGPLDPGQLLGMPATLTVEEGVPRVGLEG